MAAPKKSKTSRIAVICPVCRLEVDVDQDGNLVAHWYRASASRSLRCNGSFGPAITQEVDAPAAEPQPPAGQDQQEDPEKQ